MAYWDGSLATTDDACDGWAVDWFADASDATWIVTRPWEKLLWKKGRSLAFPWVALDGMDIGCCRPRQMVDSFPLASWVMDYSVSTWDYCLSYRAEAYWYSHAGHVPTKLDENKGHSNAGGR